MKRLILAAVAILAFTVAMGIRADATTATVESSVTLSQSDECGAVDIIATLVDGWQGNGAIHVQLDGLDEPDIVLNEAPPQDFSGDYVVTTNVGDGVFVQVQVEDTDFGDTGEVASADLLTSVTPCPTPEPEASAVLEICKREIASFEDSFDFDTNFGQDIDVEDGECQGFNLGGKHLGVVLEVTESARVDTELVDIDCDVLDGVVNADEDVEDATASFILSDGDHLRCTFTNALPAPEPEATPVDVCANIEGVQTVVPVDHTIEFVGELTICLPEEAPAPSVTPPSISPPNTGDGGLR